MSVYEIMFRDTVDGIDWSPVIRPQEFDSPIRLVAYYEPDGDSKEFTTQADKDGYRLLPDYSVVKTDAEGDLEETQPGPVSGKVEAGTDVTITTTNYAQNLTKEFSVSWVDNNSSSRPELTASNFVLKYKVGEGEWIEVNGDALEDLGISSMPGFQQVENDPSRYCYTGLPSVDAEGNPVEYKPFRTPDFPAEPGCPCTMKRVSGTSTSSVRPWTL